MKQTMKRQSIRKTNRSQELAECLKPNPVYYPNPITFQKANQFNNGSRKRPLELLEDFISLDNDDGDNQGSHGNGKESGASTGYDSYVHWFRSDLRVNDNRGLAYAYRRARAEDRPIHGLYVINEHDWVAHMESGWKLTFIVEALKELGSSLSKYGIELHVRQFEPDKPLLSNSKAFSEWFVHTVEEITGTGNSTLVTANLQYEVDELYRDGRIARLGNTRDNFKLRLFHDQCIVRPGALTTGKGSQYTVFTPWYKKWVSYIEQDIDGTLKTPHGSLNHPTDTKDFQQLPIDYRLPERFTSYIPEQHLHTPPATEAAALEAMKKFIEGRGTKYNENKDLLATDGTSLLSGYITIGIISTRTVVLSAYLANNRHIMNKNKEVKNNNSLETFIKEIAWRDFYKHVLCHWPFLSMDLPFKFETLNIKWQQDTTHFEQWCYGETGVPIVDAIMLQLLHTGYINNRARMITASFLAKNLLVDWRYGERWFRKHLIDYDVASNIGGWGFCSSTGVDCQPYFRVFNMTLQSQKFDPDGKFIRRWLHLPQTTDVHQPSDTAIVDLKESRERALEKYREVM